MAKSRLKTLNIKRYLGGNPIQPKMWRSHQRRFVFLNSISLLLLVELYMFTFSMLVLHDFYAYIEDNIRFKCGGRVCVFLFLFFFFIFVGFYFSIYFRRFLLVFVFGFCFHKKKKIENRKRQKDEVCLCDRVLGCP